MVHVSYESIRLFLAKMFYANIIILMFLFFDFLSAYMWGVIFLRSQKPPIFDGERIELFQVSNDGEART